MDSAYRGDVATRGGLNIMPRASSSELSLPLGRSVADGAGCGAVPTFAFRRYGLLFDVTGASSSESSSRTMTLGSGDTVGGGVGGLEGTRLGRGGVVGSSSEISITSAAGALIVVRGVTTATSFGFGFSTRRSSLTKHGGNDSGVAGTFLEDIR